ncbi:MAG: hypothetical protein COX17_05495 [Deltaproteobacteria bacterium CG23_combo_of_CG06-09_8_20_14_all_60_8]|nr:MAG: hypothetical protein AUK28_02210 [Desulfobacterales bacterium CG2_30_60_27]PIP43716.1 MAG: hypothetical protein COX17_05495 [Deltaproteobacteria bacterium CG23_combo_of_CG06-09_8_20_14_all_60_8]
MNRHKCFLTLLFLCLFLPTLAPGEEAEEEEILAGTVIFTQLAGKYTYLQIKQEDKEVWLAAAAFEVAVGDKIEYMGGTPMVNFYAKAMDRTFDEILFLSNIRKAVDVQQEKKTEGAKLADIPDDNYHRNISPGQAAIVPPAPGEVVKAATELTIAELFMRRGELADQTVSMRGKVLKLSKNILGRTWVTLADGSGVAPDDKLLATTKQEVQIGETLAVTGIVRIDINLGSGYAYKVMLEEATFTR